MTCDNDKPKTKLMSRRGFLLASCLALPPVALLDATEIEPTELKITTKKLANGSASCRFLHFSDLHFKGDRAYTAQLVKTINGLSPDFVCFTGDIVENLPFLKEALGFIEQIKSPVFGVQGNHEFLCGATDAEIAPSFAKTGGAWLSNREQLICGERVNLIGVACVAPSLIPPRAGVKNILLVHYPMRVEKQEGHRYDLILAGHSHGGQVRLPLIGPLFLPRGVGPYDYGLYNTPAGTLYVTSGIGCMGGTIRFNCRPEVTVFEI
jgi:predicted MPP superfamily phosphohydrolase